MRTGWLFAHIALIFTGYAALFLSFCASLLYLIQERSSEVEKARAGILLRLPALEVIDQIGYRSLLLGFPFMTLGLVAGIGRGAEHLRAVDFLDPKILLSLLMWAVYLVMVFTRWNAGWRGRRAAFWRPWRLSPRWWPGRRTTSATIHRFVQS